MPAEQIFIVDAFFRYSAVSLYLLLVALILRDFKSRKIAWLGAWSAMSGAAYLTCTNPALNALMGPAMVPIELFCHTGQIAIWLFSLSQFKDKLDLWPRYILIAVGFYLLSRANFVVFADSDTALAFAVYLAYSVARFALIGHMLFVAWQGRDEDLIEARRSFRVIYIIAVSAVTFAISATETWFPMTRFGDGMQLLQAIMMWALAMLLVWLVIGLRTQAFVGGAAIAGNGKRSGPSDPAERHDLETVMRLIEQDRLYLTPGLTIAGLADKAGLPEHRLRRLINAHLGYRNFADFLNHYRITAAKERLAGVKDRNIPILTIAMELGYGSLGPFNRAFKERTGVTPSEFRRARLAEG